jgi:hypothetical protein
LSWATSLSKIAIAIRKRSEFFYNWQIHLNAGNDPRLLEPYLKELLDRVIKAKETSGHSSPTSIVVHAPDLPEVKCRKAYT